MRNFRNWEIWKLSRKFVVEIYMITKDFPIEEKYGLTNQLRRASVSIPANIAEGAGRQSEKELKQFLHISMGSSFEVETMIYISNDLDYITIDRQEKLCSELNLIQAKLSAFISKLK